MKHLAPRNMLHNIGAPRLRLRVMLVEQFPDDRKILEGVLGSSTRTKELLALRFRIDKRIRENLRAQEFFSEAGPMSDSYEVTS